MTVSGELVFVIGTSRYCQDRIDMDVLSGNN